MQPQLLDLISNRLSLLKLLTKPLIRKGRQTYLVPLGGKTESTLNYPCLWQISALPFWGRKLVTPIFSRPKKGPPSPSFDLSKKCEHHFRAEGHTLEERYHLRDCVQDFIDNKLIQFDNVVALNIITNPLPPHKEGNVNAAIIIVEERISDFSSPSFLWKAMLRALVQESHLDLKGIRTLGFD